MAAPTLREALAETTRARIVEAVAELISEEHPAALSVPAVAERAGLSVRTVYRHYPTKEALIDGIAAVGDQDARADIAGSSLTRENLGQYLPRLWAELAQRLPLVRAQHHTPAGRAVRRHRLVDRRRELDRALAQEALGLDDGAQRRLGDLIILVTSSAALLELTDQLGYQVEEAARLAVWATDALIDHATIHPEVGA